jgi:hypothetical protein
MTKDQREILHNRMIKAGVTEEKTFFEFTLGGQKKTLTWAAEYIRNFEKFLFEWRMSVVQKKYPIEYSNALKTLGCENIAEIEAGDRADVLSAMSRIQGPAEKS